MKTSLEHNRISGSSKSGKPNLWTHKSVSKPVSRLCKPASQILAWSRVGHIVFCSFSFLRYFSALVLPLSQNRELPSSISNQFLFISQPFLCQDQSLKRLPMHFIFIKHFSIIISSLVLHHFFTISFTREQYLSISLSNFFIFHLFSC